MLRPWVLAFLLAGGIAAPSHATECLDYSHYLHWVGHLGTPDSGRSVATFGQWAYLGGDSLHILDVSDPAFPRTVSELDLHGSVSGIASLGPILFVASIRRLIVVNAQVPESPIVLGSVDLPATARRVTLRGLVAYVPCHEAGVAIVDVSDFSHPRIVGIVNTPGRALDVAIDANVAYIADYEWGVNIVNVADPARPEPIGYIPPENLSGRRRAARCVVDHGRLLVAWECLLDVYDLLQRPERPILTGTSTTCSVAALTAGVSNALTGNLFEIDVLDLSSPAVPIHARVSLPGPPIDVAWNGDKAYVADNNGGIEILQTQSLENAPPLAQVAGEGNAGAAVGTIAYLASLDLQIHDLSDPRAPIQLSTMQLYARPANWIVILDNTAFVGASRGLEAVDITDPRAPNHLAEWPGWDILDAGAASSRLYLVDRTGLTIVDATVPTELPELGHFEWPSARAVAARGDQVILGGQDSLKILDVSDPTMPSVLGGAWLGMGQQVTDVAVEGRWAFVSLRARSMLLVVDISQPSAPRVVAELRLPGYDPVSIEVRDDVVWVACGKEVLLIDVRDPLKPRRIGLAALPTAFGYVSDLALVDDAALVVRRGGVEGFATFPLPCLGPTPVTVSELEATRTADGVRIRARLASPVDRVSLLRAEGDNLARAEVVHDESSPTAGTWEHVDTAAREDFSYTYWLETSMDREHTRSAALFVAAAGTRGLRLALVSRNPSFGPARISFALARPAFARLDIYDVAGRLVRRLHHGPTVASGILDWDGRDDAGEATAAGLYILRLESGGQTAAVRLVRTR